MSNNRCFKLTALLLAACMLFCTPVFTAAADNSTASDATEPFAVLMQSAVLDETFVRSAKVQDAQGNEVADPANADPNNALVLNLQVSEGNGAEGQASMLPENTDIVRMYYQLDNRLKAYDGENDDVVWTFDDHEKQLVFKWKNGRKSFFSAAVAVAPNLPAQNDLSGEYLLVTRNKKSIVDENGWAGGGRINALAYSEKDSLIYLESLNVPVWVLTHVSGDYYTIHSRNTGAYIRIDGQKAMLENADEASAQKLLLKASGDSYFISCNGYGLNNYNLKTEDGFGAWKLGNGDNEKFRLVAPTSVATAPTNDISGTWAITFANNRKYILSADETGAVKAVGYVTNNDNKGLFPGDNVSFWTFENVTRDWYTIHTDTGYLNIDETGVRVSGTAQALLARFNGNNVFLTTGVNSSDYTLKSLNADGFGLANGTKVYNDETRITLKDATAVAGRPVQLSGSYALVNENTNGAVVAETIDATKIKSVPFYRTESGTVFSSEGEIATWTFTQRNGNWYSLQAENGKYMNITSNGVVLSDTETLVYIQEFNGKYRFTNGPVYALNNAGGNSRGGYGVYDRGEGKDRSEWMTLTAAVAPDSAVLVFDVNNGKGSTVPAAKEIQPGSAVTLPEYDGTKNNGAFIGWSRDNNIYNNVAGKNNSYREIYLPGDVYTTGGESEKLYAVYNERPADANFYIRLDGAIPDEPGDYQSSQYSKGIAISDTVRIGRWVVDVSAGKAIEGNHVANAVAANLKAFPTDDQIRAMVPGYNPETMYVHWYVLKYAGSWHVDGVIRQKTGNTVAYSTNVEGELKNEVRNMPLGFQLGENDENVTAGADSKGQVMTPTMEGYTFDGWNTEKDGSGTAYASGKEINVDEDVTLYAQWKLDEGLEIRAFTDWPEGKIGFPGAVVNLSSELIGFENKEYTLQWQHSTDGENWIDEPGANEDTYSFILSEENARYYWRIVANDIKDKE